MAPVMPRGIDVFSHARHAPTANLSKTDILGDLFNRELLSRYRPSQPILRP